MFLTCSSWISGSVCLICSSWMSGSVCLTCSSWMSASTCLWVRWTTDLLAWGAGWLFFNQGAALLHSACFGETLQVSCYACPFIWRCCCQFVNVVQVCVVHVVHQLHKGAKMWIPQTLFQRSRPLSSSDLFLSFCLSLEKERKTVLLMQDDFIWIWFLLL